MPHKVILVILDGLNYQVAEHALGHLQAYRAAGRAQLYKLDCELPALSRPLYECLLTGSAPSKVAWCTIRSCACRISRACFTSPAQLA